MEASSGEKEKRTCYILSVCFKMPRKAGKMKHFSSLQMNSHKFNACIDNVYQALFSLPTKMRPGFKATD